ncbi:MAG: hypothetical protein ABI165_04250 [Bryobacteraceae bacterium]
MNEPAHTNDRLKAAVRGVAPPPYLDARIRSGIRSGPRRRSWELALVPAAAALAVCLGVGIAYQYGHLRFTPSSRDSYIAAVSSHVATLMRVGLSDHIDCAVFRKYPKNPLPAETFIEKLGPRYSGLIPIVRRQVPAGYKLVIAHRCHVYGRAFVHLVLKNDSHLLSLVITRRQPDESFDVRSFIHQAGVQRFQIAAFQNQDFLVYFISDLPQPENTDMMLALAPAVNKYLTAL